MALLNTVVRKYTPPTCTLEVRGKESLLSKWASRPILQDLKFKLSFDDPRQPDDKQVSIWGDRAGLEALSAAVTDYIQNFLQSRDGEVEVNGKQPIVDSLPRKQTNSRSAIDLPITQIETNTTVASDTAPTKVIPISPVFQNQILNPYLKPKGLVTHELFLGALQTPESGSSIDLSALQLFDLATALDAYGAEMLSVPSLGKTRPAIPLWGYAAGAAALLAAGVGLAPAAMKLANTSNVVVVEPSPESSAVTAAAPSTDLALAPTNPASPAPLASPGGSNLPAQNNLTLGAVPPGSSTPPSAVPPGSSIPSGAVPPGSSIPPGAISSNIPNLPSSLGNTGQPAPVTGSGLTPPPNSGAAGQAPVTSQNIPNAARQRSRQRSTQYGFPQGVVLSPLGGGNSTSSHSSTSSRNNSGLKTFVVNPDNPSRSSRNNQNTASGTRRSVGSKKSRNSVPTITPGKVQPYVDPGDNPSDLAASPAGIPSPESQGVESKKNPNSSPQRQVVRSQSPKKLEIATSVPTLPRFTAEDLAASSPLNSPASSESSEPEASDPVVPQFVPNASPPPLGEIPPLTDSATTSSPAPSNESPNSPLAATSTNTPNTVPAPRSAAVLNQPNSGITSNGSIDSNSLVAVPVQASEIKRYFEGQWKPIKDVKQSLDYTLFLDKSGSITRIVPITEVSARYIDRTGMPKLTNVPLVSPVSSPQMKIRVSLDPDGTVKTFQEP